MQSGLNLSLDGGRHLIVSDIALAHFSAHRQLDPSAPEAGGGLFVSHCDSGFLLSSATGPYIQDLRRRFAYRVASHSLNVDIRKKRKQGEYFIGLWHTHPEQLASPSCLDLAAMRQLFNNNVHSLEAMLMVIVGTLCPPDGLWIGLHSRAQYQCVYEGHPKSGAVDLQRTR